MGSRRNNLATGFLLALALVLAAGAVAAQTTRVVHSGESIQAAVNASAAGDIVLVDVGVFVEQVHIVTAGLTLRGAGPGATVIRSPAHLSASFYSSATNYPIVFVEETDGVTVADLTIDGDHLGAFNIRFLGLAYWNAGGTVDNVDIVNVRESPLTALMHGVGLYAFNDDGGAHDLVLRDLDVEEFQRAGATLGGPGLTVDAERVTVTGLGPNAVIAQLGIQISDAANGTLTDCVVEDIQYTSSPGSASGILIYQSLGADILDTRLARCQNSVYFNDSPGSFVGGEITEPVANGMSLLTSSTFTPAPELRDAPEPYERDLYPALMLKNGPVVISVADCDLLGAGSAAGTWAVSVLPAGALDLAVTGCRIEGWGVGVRPLDRGGSLNAALNGNGFADCGLAVSSTYATVIDASGNGYGAADRAAVLGLLDGVIDYTPWLPYAADASADPGFQTARDDVRVDAASPQTGAAGRVAEAVTLADPDAVVTLLPGEYLEPGQILVDRPLTVLGDPGDRPLLRPTDDTAAAGDAAAWWLVAASGSLDLADVVLDGAGRAVAEALRAHGPGSLTGCGLRDFAFESSGPAYAGTALRCLDAPWIVRDNVFTGLGRAGVHVSGAGAAGATIVGNAYAGKGAGDWRDHGVILEGGAAARVDSNDVGGCLGVASIGGAGSAAVHVEGAGSSLLLNGNDLSGNTAGLTVGADALDTPSATARDNDFGDNTEWGVVNFGSVVVDALQNWWGHASGPYHPTLNPGGAGVPVSDNVLFDPWQGVAGLELSPTGPGPVSCTGSLTVDVVYSPPTGGAGLAAFSVTLGVSPELVFGPGDVRDGYLMAAAGDHDFQVTDNGDGTVTVADALSGAPPGAAGPGVLFSYTVHGVAEGTAALDIVDASLTDDFGFGIYAATVGAVLDVACGPDPLVAGLALTPTRLGPVPCLEGVLVDVRYAPGPSTPPLRGYELTLASTPELQFSAVDAADGDAFTTLAGAGGHFFSARNDGAGGVIVTDALLGVTPGLTEAGVLCRLLVHTAGEGPAAVRILQHKLRDLTNAVITAEAADAVIDMVCEPTDVPTTALFRLEQNVPNPFNPSTRIRFHLPTAARVRVAVYALDGSLAAVLLDGPCTEGPHEVTWNGRLEGGRPAASGLYLCRLEAGGRGDVLKMALIR